MHPRGLATLVLAALVAGCASPAVDLPDVAPSVSFEAIRFDTDLGAFTVLLYPEAAPETVAHVKTLTGEGYWTGREFNRVFPGFVIQVIDRAGGATEDGRRVPLETREAYHFSAGAAGIARGEEPDSGGPEFFVMDFATHHLDGNYTVWGQVFEGMDAVRRIARVDAVDFTGLPVYPPVLADRAPVDPVRITGAQVLTVDLPRASADELPREVAKRLRTEDFVHSMDWPKNLRVGVEGSTTWYARPLDADTPPPAPTEVRIRVQGQEHPVEGDPVAEGVYAWRWTPTEAGEHDATLVTGGREFATLRLRVDP